MQSEQPQVKLPVQQPVQPPKTVEKNMVSVDDYIKEMMNENAVPL